MILASDRPEYQTLHEEFLRQWPLERLAGMALDEYAIGAGDDNSFCYWLEFRLGAIGSMRGGSASKFGIYRRKNRDKPVSPRYRHDDRYVWPIGWGENAEEVFGKVRDRVSRVAALARSGDIRAIDAIDLGRVFQWKIAFHYQDFGHPTVVPAFSRPYLRHLLDTYASDPEARRETKSWPMSRFHETLSPLRPAGMDLLTFVSRAGPPPEAADLPSGATPESPTAALADGEADEPVAFPLNAIFHGPPGTGKTYLTRRRAVEICDGRSWRRRSADAVAARYEALRQEGRIAFVTFHQSYGYEEFVEGIRPRLIDPETADGDGAEGAGGGIVYVLQPGIFRTMCSRATGLKAERNPVAGSVLPADVRVWKMSLGNTRLSEDDDVFAECLEHDQIRLGWGSGIDFAGCDTREAVRERYQAARRPAADGDSDEGAVTIINQFKNKMAVGDVVVVSRGNRKFGAIGRVTGQYQRIDRENYDQVRTVEWLVRFEGDYPECGRIYRRRFSQQTLYVLDPALLRRDNIQALVRGTADEASRPHVLVIDEINRGNVARIFGELITLLEPDKRLGAKNEIRVRLPYSGIDFGVPANLYVVGTMNTADRSVAALDAALRRRFDFEEMTPDAEALRTVLDGHGMADGRVEGVDVPGLLAVLNQRIEARFDRDHRLGHAYFMDVRSLDDLRNAFLRRVIPLLREYFHDDPRRIAGVLNVAADADEGDPVLLLATSRPGAGDGGEWGALDVNPAFREADAEDLAEYFNALLDETDQDA